MRYGDGYVDGLGGADSNIGHLVGRAAQQECGNVGVEFVRQRVEFEEPLQSGDHRQAHEVFASAHDFDGGKDRLVGPGRVGETTDQRQHDAALCAHLVNLVLQQRQRRREEVVKKVILPHVLHNRGHRRQQLLAHSPVGIGEQRLQTLRETGAQTGRLFGDNRKLLNDPQTHHGVLVLHELHDQVREVHGDRFGANLGSNVHAQVRQQLAHVGDGILGQVHRGGGQLADKLRRADDF
mmetsp:Transcript_13962/g.24600  ORF Transcript_13962/g.24600 Transcript_13962/m.24600 type:complete len:237 (-) Transcript_13962:1102-1812(-)